MESHKHPKGKRAKKWKEYLFQFVLIFLAVTLSYLAENLRENIASHRLANTYANNLLNDLKSDTTQLGDGIRGGAGMAANNIRTFVDLVAEQSPDNMQTGKLYWYGLWGGYPEGFVPNNTTFEAMTNGGKFELFNYNKLGRYIARYYKDTENIKMKSEQDQLIYSEARKLHAQIFDSKYNAAANVVAQANYRHFSQARIDSFIQTNPPLLSRDRTLINEYAELCRSRFMSGYLHLLEKARQDADSAISKIHESGFND